MLTEIYASKYTPEVFYEAIKEIAAALNSGNPVDVRPVKGDPDVESAHVDVLGQSVQTVEFFSVSNHWESQPSVDKEWIYGLEISGSVLFSISYLDNSRPRFSISTLKELTTDKEIRDFFLKPNHELSIEGGQTGDLIRGASNQDYLLGYGGSDVIFGGDDGDTIMGGNAYPTLKGDGADTLYGGAGNDEIRGGQGDDRLIGGIDTDTLYGDGGNDTFVFDSLGQGHANVMDFSHRHDTIELDHSAFAELKVGKLDEDAFAVFREKSSFKEEEDKGDRILVDIRHRSIYYDADGSGGHFKPVMIAQVHHLPQFHADDFMIV